MRGSLTGRGCLAHEPLKPPTTPNPDTALPPPSRGLAAPPPARNPRAGGPSSSRGVPVLGLRPADAVLRFLRSGPPPGRPARRDVVRPAPAEQRLPPGAAIALHGLRPAVPGRLPPAVLARLRPGGTSVISAVGLRVRASALRAFASCARSPIGVPRTPARISPAHPQPAREGGGDPGQAAAGRPPSGTGQDRSVARRAPTRPPPVVTRRAASLSDNSCYRTLPSARPALGRPPHTRPPALT